MRPDASASGLLSDEYDRASVLLVVRDANGSIVGTARFVRPTSIGFHAESVFDIDLRDLTRDRLAEFGRLAVAPVHRGGERLVVLGLLKAVFECMVESGVVRVLAFLPPILADSFARLGCKPIPLRVFGLSERCLLNRLPMQPYFESQSVAPVIYDLESMIYDVGVRRELVSERIRLPSD